jgi:hypothetical protein
MMALLQKFEEEDRGQAEAQEDRDEEEEEDNLVEKLEGVNLSEHRLFSYICWELTVLSRFDILG